LWVNINILNQLVELVFRNPKHFVTIPKMGDVKATDKEKGRMIYLRDGQSFASDMKVEMVRIVSNINSDKSDDSKDKAIVINFQDTCNVIMIRVTEDEDVEEICKEVSLDIDRGYGCSLADVIEDIIETRVEAAVRVALDKLNVNPRGILKTGLPKLDDTRAVTFE